MSCLHIVKVIRPFKMKILSIRIQLNNPTNTIIYRQIHAVFIFRRFFVLLERIVFVDHDTGRHFQKGKRRGTRSRENQHLSKLQTTLENFKVAERRSSGRDLIDDAGDYKKKKKQQIIIK